RETRREQVARRRQRRLAALPEPGDPAGRADVLRQLEVDVLDAAARARDELARAVALAERRDAERAVADARDRRRLVPDRDRVADAEAGRARHRDRPVARLRAGRADERVQLAGDPRLDG